MIDTFKLDQEGPVWASGLIKALNLLVAQVNTELAARDLTNEKLQRDLTEEKRLRLSMSRTSPRRV